MSDHETSSSETDESEADASARKLSRRSRTNSLLEEPKVVHNKTSQCMETCSAGLVVHGSDHYYGDGENGCAKNKCSAQQCHSHASTAIIPGPSRWLLQAIR